jgi:hypothetical protein
MKFRWRESFWIALAWRYAAHAAMVALALWNERRAAPPLPDLVLSWVPHVDWVERHNYQLWLVAYVPVGIALLVRDRAAGIRMLWIGGWLSLLRGLTIPLTGLGPIHGPDVNAGASFETLRRAWLAIVNPVSALTTDAAQVGLTKDYFFSGHVASTFLLWLYCRGRGVLAPIALASHLFVTATVFLAHIHYTIDVVGAWAATLAVYVVAERSVPISGSTPAPSPPDPSRRPADRPSAPAPRRAPGA